MNALTTTEIERLQQCEGIIEQGRQTFVEVGLALAEIKEQKLYRRDYDTFEVYCQTRWDFTRQYAYELIKSANVAAKLVPEMSTIVDKIPNEAVARELAKVPENNRKAVLEQASQDGPPTAKEVKAVAASFGPPPAPAPKSKSKPSFRLHDDVGRGVPAHLEPLWESTGEEVGEFLRMLSHIRGALKGYQDKPPIGYAEVNLQEVLSHLNDVYTLLKLAVPYSVCPSCQGRESITATCVMCKHRGAVSKFFWDTCVPKELKDIVLKTVAKEKGKK